MNKFFFNISTSFSFSNAWLKCLILTSFLFLSACTITSDELSKEANEAALNNPLWKTHQAEVEKIALSEYSAKGSFAYISTDFRQSASFYWEQQSKESYHLRLLNPLGQTVIFITVDDNQTKITDDKGQVYNYSNPEEAILDLANMDIPLTQLRLWMLGLPGEATEITLNSNYELAAALYKSKESNLIWQVKYINYDRNLPTSLPSQLEIVQKNGDEELTIKLKINRWKS
ncbi:lipoprotein insertase outer membrane protein LolB [Thorsellia kenyensis]|uniref:Outer-membrane lipoprotein LolB n=1 Tax=Thorsellia kenyensis TaxID=1549888 RepID=A0ABV6CB09_9GAMM